jgi:shikimate dehydrogenase
MNKIFGLLGETLGHSFSPLIHRFLGDYEYPLYEIAPADFDTFMTERRFGGINVTIPYKQAVLPYCASLSDEARRTGSINTVIKDGHGDLHGHNTDYYGFCFLLEYSGISPEGQKVLILGNGGAAKTVRAALQDLGAREVITVSRNGENNYGNIARHYGAEVIINTTPAGMYPDNGGSPLCLAGFEGLEGVVDLIYNPMRTRLLLDAGRMGVPCANGLPMLAAQAEMASRLFTGGPARPEITEEITGRICKRMRNIVLIGMPGCGKSTVGGVLSRMMGRICADIDVLIETASGRSIPEILAKDGESAFRIMETRVLGEEAKKSGIVIATGGGVVTQPENFDLLRQNSLVVYLKRELGKLKTDGRPLSLGAGVEALAGQRLPLYEAWSDCAVEVEADPEQTAARIMERIA